MQRAFRCQVAFYIASAEQLSLDNCSQKYLEGDPLKPYHILE